MNAGVTQLAESQPSKLLVAGSIPVARSILLRSKPAAKDRELRAAEDALRSSEASGSRLPFWSEGGRVFIADAHWRDRHFAHVAQLAEHVLGKDGVSSSILLVGSILTDIIIPS